MNDGQELVGKIVECEAYLGELSCCEIALLKQAMNIVLPRLL
jgi:3-methyladenine DNA glycosylase Mpg